MGGTNRLVTTDFFFVYHMPSAVLPLLNGTWNLYEPFVDDHVRTQNNLFTHILLKSTTLSDLHNGRQKPKANIQSNPTSRNK